MQVTGVDVCMVVLYILPGSVLEAQDVNKAHETSKNLWPFGGVSSLTIFDRWNPNPAFSTNSISY